MEEKRRENHQEIDGERYVRLDVKSSYKKPTMEEIRNLDKEETRSEYEFKPKKKFYDGLISSG